MSAAIKAERRGNARVIPIDKDSWRARRVARFQRSVRYAAAAKAGRTAFRVRQADVARALRLSLTAIRNRESGFYAWAFSADAELARYLRVCARLAR
jgi:hypothetical protein